MLIKRRIVGYDKTIQFNDEINMDNYEFFNTNASFIGDGYVMIEIPYTVHKYETCVDAYMDKVIYCDYDMIDLSEFLM